MIPLLFSLCSFTNADPDHQYTVNDYAESSPICIRKAGTDEEPVLYLE